MTVEAKICGLNDPVAVAAAVEGGARFVGFVFFPPSPRSVTPADAAGLTASVPQAVIRVGLVVDADDDALEGIVSVSGVDMLQLHGHETPERVRSIRRRFGLPVMKAVAIATREDVDEARRYDAVADRLMFDAKPPKEASRPGGNAEPFDWSLLRGCSSPIPWVLAGGLDVDNVAEAVRISGATAVDVSSGVEDRPGVKNVEKIRSFLRVAARL